MEYGFSINNINLSFEVTDQKEIALTQFSFGDFSSPKREKLVWHCPVDVHITGGNPDAHHGAKHIGATEIFSLKYDSHRRYKNEFGEKLELYLANEKISVVQHYQFYNGISIVRSWCSVKNVSNENVGLEYLSSFSYTGLEDDAPEIYIPHNSWYSELGWKKHTVKELGMERIVSASTKRISLSNTGSWSSKEYLPMGAIADTANTLLWQIETNGSWHWEIGDTADLLYLKLSGPTEQENGWYKELKPGESFEGVKAAIALGADFNDALCQMTKYRRNIFKNNPENAAIPVIFNDYMNCLFGDPTTEKLLPIIDKAAEAGAEYFCIDAGWYADGKWWDTVGEWMPCGWRFPNGIKEVLDHIKEKGMVPGLWLEIEVMGINCPILDRFDDTCFFMRHGKRVIDHGRYQLDFRSDKVRRFATGVIDRLVTEYGVGYIKMDYNIEAGLGTESDADSFGDGLLQHNRAYLKWIDEIKERHPALIIENCGSGGMRMDYAMLSKCHLQSTSDQTDYRHAAVIAANAPTAVLPEQAAVWAYPLADGDQNEVAFNMINAMLMRIHLSGDILNLNDNKFAQVKEGIECYKNLRSKISEFIPFYPLGLNDQRNGFVCVGYKAGEEKYLAVWKKQTEKKELFIPMGSVADAKILYPADTQCKIETKANGINVIMPENFSAVIIKTL